MPEPAPAVRIFISYTHDSDEHAAKVRRLADSLRTVGLLTVLDQYESPGPSAGWPFWMERELQAANYVVCVCSATYRRRVDGLEAPDKGKGAAWEGNLIRNLLHDAKSDTRKFVPVLFDAEPDDSVPLMMKQFHRHKLPKGFPDLCRHLAGQTSPPPPVNPELRVVPPKPAPTLDPAWNLAGMVEGGGPVATNAAAPTVAPTKPTVTREQAKAELHDLLVSLMSADELRRFVAYGPHGARLSSSLPGSSVSLGVLTTELIALLERDGLLGPDLFERLRQDRPYRAKDIDSVARLWSELQR
ncbi:SEFIR domain-containing protein [Nannocystis radixulma]|uniref:TIR domain-containing protein n=1 Tax=Nannocystis radixulma TaxID=2995305 RepID=A0ABT5BM54_9BACT|nr:SEFIR domain-containing protein [Nannocystis radixulma]MDC0675177.1 TIR domain-containing protein [Nannocystis radixulma]